MIVEIELTYVHRVSSKQDGVLFGCEPRHRDGVLVDGQR
jgi:hypothetical protein